MGILILLPVLNERSNIEELLARIARGLAGRSYTICIVDDGSRDGTVEWLKARLAKPHSHFHLIQRLKTSRGSKRGGALRAALVWGLKHTPHEIFVEMDGDLSHRPEELKEGIAFVERGACDVAIASKYLPGSWVTNRPWGRRMVSLICGAAVRAVISSKVRDYSNGYRFYSRAAADLIVAHKIRYTSPIYLTEVLALWMHSGLRVREFPSTYVGRN
jgi:dolichol-phosphate mannosyltransferase